MSLKKFESFVIENYQKNDENKLASLEVDDKKADGSLQPLKVGSKKEDLITHLSKVQNVYNKEDLSNMNIDQLTNLEREVANAKEEEISESKKWIKDAIKRPGSLRRKLHKGKGEKISVPEIDSELQALRAKDKDKRKPGLQLSKRDRTKQKELVLAKTLKGLRRK